MLNTKKWIAVLVTALSFSSSVNGQKHLSITDSTILEVLPFGDIDYLISPVLDDYVYEVHQECPHLVEVYVGKPYRCELTAEMINDTVSYLVLSDTAKKDTAFSLINTDGGKTYKKYYPNGQLMQEGVLTNLDVQNIQYEMILINSNDEQFCKNWVDSIYTNRPIAVGEWKFYYENGTLASTGEFLAETTVFVEQVLDPYSAEPLLELTINDYTHAHKNGVWEYFNNQGELILSQTIENKSVTTMICLPSK